ncbi:MAG: type II secretion system protein [Phycisphaerae bacterium]|nr:type II secretion system protein [Phycisphaerae bacterium]
MNESKSKAGNSKRRTESTSEREAYSVSSRRRGFTLLELLVVIGILAVVVSILLPALSSARRSGMRAACGARLRELGRALVMYANDHDDRAIPLAYTDMAVIGSGPAVYWWGTNESGAVDHERGFTWPYLQTIPSPSSVFECPEQPWGSYRPQGAAQAITSTYGYNGYYLSPSQTPGFSFQIGHREWKTLSRVREASQVFVFADAMIDLGGALPRNSALLDPPMLFDGAGWTLNESPTTSFRHADRAQAVHADGHVEAYRSRPAWLTSSRWRIGSVGVENGPHYVPDWRDWIAAP